MKRFPLILSLSLYSGFAFSAERKACFQIEGMTCGNCAKGINSLLLKESGVKNAETSFPTKSSIVHFDDKKISDKKIADLITTAGYKVSIQECKNFGSETKKDLKL